MTRISFPMSLSLIGALAIASASWAEESKSLLTRVAEWQYPKSKINGATMSDAPTLNSKGERTVASMQCTTVLTTRDPVAKVVAYYKAKLAPVAAPDKATPGDSLTTDSAQSVTFHEDSENRPLDLHMILVNTDKTSTTLVISRAKGEDETHIAWTQYSKL